MELFFFFFNSNENLSGPSTLTWHRLHWCVTSLYFSFGFSATKFTCTRMFYSTVNSLPNTVMVQEMTVNGNICR